MNITTLWDNFLLKIKTEVNPLAFDTWFRNTKLFSIDDGRALIIVPMPIHKKHLAENYGDLIENIFNLLTGTNFEIDFLLDEELEQKKEIEIEGVPFISAIETN